MIPTRHELQQILDMVGGRVGKIDTLLGDVVNAQSQVALGDYSLRCRHGNLGIEQCDQMRGLVPRDGKWNEAQRTDIDEWVELLLLNDAVNGRALGPHRARAGSERLVLVGTFCSADLVHVVCWRDRRFGSLWGHRVSTI